MHPPANPCILAAIVTDPASPLEFVNDALRYLRPLHEQTARSVTSTYQIDDPDTRDELISHVTAQLWLKKYDPPQGAYEGWCWRVMRNKLISLLRQRQREQAAPDDRFANHPDERYRLDLQERLEAIDRSTPFTASDMERVWEWSTDLMRVLLLTRSLLWPRVPANEWLRWLAGVGITSPFPPPGYRDEEDTIRHRVLAEALGMEMHTLHVNWKRWRRRLQELESVKGDTQ